MSHTPHELHEAFPEFAQKIHALKLSDAHFNRLAGEYHTLNREIHRIESDVAPTSALVLEGLKKQRLHLSDQIQAILAAPANTGT